MEFKGHGYAPASGPETAPLLFVGEALGREEAYAGRPFVGASGDFINRLLKKCGLDRDAIRVDNCIRCQPPGDNLLGASYETEALQHCRYLDGTLDEGHRAIVAVGATATRRLLGLGKDRFKLDNWHGCPTLDKTGKHWVIPTYHPAYLLRGNHKLKGTMAWDIKQAVEVSNGRWEREGASLVVDPEPAWFHHWVDAYISSLGQGVPPWLAVDIETPDTSNAQDEGELEDESYQILRINFSYNPGEGVTVPWERQYLPDILQILQAGGTQCYWNGRYDIPRLTHNDAEPRGRLLDFMWGWHILQSDLPRGLGFVAPFYSKYGAWKHQAGSDPGIYAAIDAVQTLRVAFGIAKDLKNAGQWDVFLRHVHDLDTIVLHPAEKAGIKVDKDRLGALKTELAEVKAGISAEVDSTVPMECKPLFPATGWKRLPAESKVSRDALTTIYSNESVRKCLTCGQSEVLARHRCTDKKLKPDVIVVDQEVPRYFIREAFNCSSPKQIQDYIDTKGYKGSVSTDEKALEALYKRTKDPIFKKLIDYREVEKILSTYVEGAERRLKADSRLHAQFTHRPSTLRLSCVNPNLQNVIQDRSDPTSLAARFRSCIVAEQGCSLVEADYSGIEAVETGWFLGDPDYIRLAKLGIHAYLTSYLVGDPADLGWSDEKLSAHFKKIKKRYPKEYDRAKRCVHGTNYGLSAIGMVNNYPDDFTRKTATEVQDLYFKLCPRLPEWHDTLRKRAASQGFLGGSDHPFRYKHWFWNVYNYNAKTRGWSLGADAKRVIAFYPQSASAGVLKEACLRLMDRDNPRYIGDAYFGGTPVRALIHDSILLEVPDEKVEMVVANVHAEMSLPIIQQPCPPAWNMGPFLQIGVEVKVGKNWLEMKTLS